MKATKKIRALAGKKILLVGLGRLGGGVAAARFFASHGAQVTVTDQLSAGDLVTSLRTLKKYHIAYTLGRHDKKDFKGKDYIIFNQAVSARSQWVSYARAHCRRVYNDFTFFLSWFEQNFPHRAYLAVTGTRGKTTVTTWIGHLLKPAIVGGNIPQNGLYTIMEKLEKKSVYTLSQEGIQEKKIIKSIVLELSSFQLEYVSGTVCAPHVAVITNLSQDHLNRHGTMEEYARVKGLIFKSQKPSDILILNADNAYTKTFLAKKPKAKIIFFSLKKLSPSQEGIYLHQGNIFFKEKKHTERVSSMPYAAEHEQRNLLATLAGAHVYGMPWHVLVRRMHTLPTIHFRQEVIYRNARMTIINDSAATSPEGAIVALRALATHARTLAFICGGTDKQLNMMPLARELKKTLPIKNLFLLEGSATTKLLAQMRFLGYTKKVNLMVYHNLEDIVSAIKKEKKCTHIVLSPGAASFEKFKNEFDRGRKFNTCIKTQWSS